MELHHFTDEMVIEQIANIWQRFEEKFGEADEIRLVEEVGKMNMEISWGKKYDYEYKLGE